MFTRERNQMNHSDLFVFPSWLIFNALHSDYTLVLTSCSRNENFLISSSSEYRGKAQMWADSVFWSVSVIPPGSATYGNANTLVEGLISVEKVVLVVNSDLQSKVISFSIWLIYYVVIYRGNTSSWTSPNWLEPYSSTFTKGDFRIYWMVGLISLLSV